MKRQNNITKSDYSDEWFTDQSTVDLVVSLLNPSGLICCPFDSSKSLFVKSANLIGKGIYGMTDWLEADYDYDYLMTNPPFSIKASFKASDVFCVLGCSILCSLDGDLTK